MGSETESDYRGQVEEFGKVHSAYVALATALEAKLRRYADRRWPLAVVQARAKGVASFAKKIKVRGNFTNPLLEMNDLCGGRIIVHTEREIREICALVRDVFIVDETMSQDVVERLGTSEFGYRSVHFTLRFKGSDMPAEADNLDNKRMELQVRTFLQHAWADIVHDTLYKAKVVVPERHKRESARISAMLESAQRALDGLVEGIERYKTSYHTYKSSDQLESEIATLQAVRGVLDRRRDRDGLARDIATRYVALGQHKDAVRFLELLVTGPARRARMASALRDARETEAAERLLAWEGAPRTRAALELDVVVLGAAQGRVVDPEHRDGLDREIGMRRVALDGAGDGDGDGNGDRDRDELEMPIGIVASTRTRAELGEALYKAFRHAPPDEAQPHLELAQTLLEAAAAEQGHPKEWCILAELALRRDDQHGPETLREARGWYERALEADPTDPRSVWGYAMTRLRQEPSLAFVAPMRGTLQAAAETCEAWAAAEVYLPRALFDAGAFHILLGDVSRGLWWLCRAVHFVRVHPRARPHLQLRLDWFRRLERAGGEVGERWHTAYLTLLVAEAALQSPEVAAELQRVKDVDIAPAGAVTLLAGGCAPDAEERVREYEGRIGKAFAGYTGIIVSGGTTQGIAGVAAAAAKTAGPDCRAVGYLPRTLPSDASRSADYDLIGHTTATRFSELEPLQAWVDLLAAGVQAQSVRLLGVDGGPIAGFEYRLAMALGAAVGVFANSGRAARELLRDPYWGQQQGLMPLREEDPWVLRAFVGRATGPWLDAEKRDALAEAVHERYRTSRLENLAEEDESWKDWASLREDYKDENRNQVDQFELLLSAARAEIAPKEAPADPATLTSDDLTAMARLEHARWVVNKSLGGWRLGPVKDASAKTHPDLVGWEKLSPKTRKLDLDPVGAIEEHLDTVDRKVVRRPRPTGVDEDEG